MIRLSSTQVYPQTADVEAGAETRSASVNILSNQGQSMRVNLDLEGRAERRVVITHC
jgi:hypothetical protein